MKRLSLLLCFLFLVTNLLQSQPPARTGKDYAYFFYVSDFQPGWKPLPETEKEVEKIAKELRNNYGFTGQIFGNYKKQQILDKIETINKTQYGSDDQVLFFFSTHGHFNEEADRGYLIPTNGKFDDEKYAKSWISYDDLGNYITASPCQHVLLALDACYSGAFGDHYKSRPNKTPWDKGLDCAEKTKLALEKDTRCYFTSGSKEQRTPAKSKFAKKWLQILSQGAARGMLSLHDLEPHFYEIQNPQPEGGRFTSKDKGGNFVFVHKNACRNTVVYNNKISEDNAHWGACLENKSPELAEEHMESYPGCAHHFDALKMVTGKLKEKGESDDKNKAYPPDNMVFIKGGSFQMGSEDRGASSNEKPVHKVTLDDFYMGRFEVTFAEYDAFCDATGKEYPEDRGWGRENRPVINVTWYDAIEYCNWLSKQHNFTPVYTISKNKIDPQNLNQYDDLKWLVSVNWHAEGYRLPTEAEWEYAARSRGRNDKWAGTSDEAQLAAYGNYSGNKDGYDYTAPVGSFDSNASGLYDMSGNIWEWCWDWFDDYNKSKNTVNPKDADSGFDRVLRGGSWLSFPAYLRCTYRSFDSPNRENRNIGFRLSRADR